MVTDEQYKKLLQRVEKLEELYRSWFTLISKLKLEDNRQEMEDARKARIAHGGTSKEKSTPKRDRTKYRFNSEVYGKRQLVFEVVKRYVQEHPDVTFEELQNVFPDHLQGALGVVRSVYAAEKYKNPEKRYYFSDEDVIELHGERYAVCSQWDAKNITAFLNAAKKYYQIEEIIY